ncbi:MAG: preprotein translocase subunit SecE [Candidatus Latescibacteria bacterium]|nr:preprotein translocase subunit SecE [Candidatus Latescibacterota bacterium]
MWQKAKNFAQEVRFEFGKVVWPTREELISSTGVVLVFSAAFAIFIGLFDLVISYLWGLLID